MPQKLLSTAKLIKDFRIAVDNGRTHSVCIDLPPELGTNMGPTALELAVMSYAGCFATIFALMAKKTRVTLKDLEVKLEALKTDEAGTVSEASFKIMVKTDASEETVNRVFKLTVENCPVGKLFEKAGVKITYNMKLEK
ncbi:MAG: OsmC family protein [Candidatus Bathyarchaeota archaeon]|nr:OsmC family protein [Candidatus Bathyarchaeota archaeon]MCX8177587.1 OsmC family protein [Candidatus Bathyarchaeota archaeon]MDW8194295.1 OsmC family protein [Nitrososphaerota archaeon]